MIYDNYTISEVNTWGKEDIDEYLKRCNLPKKIWILLIRFI